MKMPFRLDEGIYFEDTKKILNWGESLEQLKMVDNPEISEDGEFIEWKSKLCFGNQKMNIQVIINDYFNENGTLEFVHIEEENETAQSIYLTAEKNSVLFKEYFGEPSQTKILYGRKTELWNINDLQIIIGIGERFTDFLIFSIHKGDKFYELSE
jgi:hypothetical protein